MNNTSTVVYKTKHFQRYKRVEGGYDKVLPAVKSAICDGADPNEILVFTHAQQGPYTLFIECSGEEFLDYMDMDKCPEQYWIEFGKQANQKRQRLLDAAVSESQDGILEALLEHTRNLTKELILTWVGNNALRELQDIATRMALGQYTPELFEEDVLDYNRHLTYI